METNSKERKLVACALIVDDDRVLITRRRADQAHPLAWELPGGKVEPGESPEAALVRELEEELGTRVSVGRIWEVLHHVYPELEVVLLVYRCHLKPGENPQCREVLELAWATPAELQHRDWLVADAPLVRRLVREGAPPSSPDRTKDSPARLTPTSRKS